jgi:c-di-GMP-binding flagellar brake protein YcgR
MDTDSIENMLRKKTFSISNGTPLSIEIEGVVYKLKSVVIGNVINEYLIIGMPNVSNLNLLKTKLLKGNAVVVRYLEGGTVFGFESKILGSVIEPKKLIFISYPELVTTHDLRDKKRYDCYILGELSLSDGTKYSAMIMDLSEKGFRVAIKAADNLNLPALNIGDQLVFHFRLSASNEILNISGEVKNVQHDRYRVIIGVMSTDGGDEFKKVTDSYITFLDDADAVS